MSGRLTPRRSPDDPLAQREALQKERDAAYAIYSDETQQRQAAQALVGSYESRVRGGALGGDAADDEQALEKTRDEYARHLSNANRALDRVRALEGDLDHLHQKHYEAFAVAAAQATDDAQVAVDDFVAAWHLAVERWNAAAEAWAPVCKAIKVAAVAPFPVSEAAIGELVRGEARAHPPSAEAITPLPGEEVMTD